MSDPAGRSVAAIQQRQAALSRQHNSTAAADRILAETLASAHAAVRDCIRRLDAIRAEIDRVLPQQDELAVDTALGARELHRFLLAKQREIAAVVDDARALSSAKSAVLHRLREQYVRPGDAPGTAGRGDPSR